MNHGERVKAPLRHLDGPAWAMEEAIEELDTWQSALDDAERLQKETAKELDSRIKECDFLVDRCKLLAGKLAARDAEVEGLRGIVPEWRWRELRDAIDAALSEEVKGGAL